MSHKIGLLAAASVVALTPVCAMAQDANAASDNEIVVTAQKRQEKLQDVPLAVSAVSADQIAERGFVNVAQLGQLAPNVNLSEGIVNPTVIVPFIRGIGMVDNTPETDLPIAVSIDGVYLASIYGGLVDAFDIQQVEILRGPQGTLQGRNAPGGAVNIVTRRPGETLVMRGSVEYGRFADFRANVGIDGPLVPDLVGFKLAAMRRHAKGYEKNLTTGERFGGRDTWALKGGLQITPGDKLKVWLSGDYTKDKSPPTAFHQVNDGIDHPRPETGDQTNTLACAMFGVCTPDPKYVTQQTSFGDNSISNWGISSNIDYDAGAATLTSVTGYRKIKDTFYLDVDGTPYPLLEVYPTTVDIKTFSQEFRISSNEGGALSFDDHVRWILGGYYMNYWFDRMQGTYVFNNDIGTDYKQRLKSYAVFGHVDIVPTDKLTISFGARQMWDKKSFLNRDADLRARKSWKKFIFDAGVNYKFTNDVMGYVRFGRGYRAGGFNPSTRPYDPETVDSWEGGIKTELFNRKLTFNLAGFYYKYSDLQRQRDVFENNAFSRQTDNAGKQHAYGVEAEITARPVQNLRLNLSVGYLKAKYDEWTDFAGVDAEGNPIPVDNSGLPVYHAPKWTINTGAAYEVPVNSGIVGTVTPSVNLYYKSSHFTQADAQPVSYENGYTLLSAALRVQDQTKRFALTVFGDNLLNEYHINSGGTLGGLSLYQQEALPRTYGVRFEVKY